MKSIESIMDDMVLVVTRTLNTKEYALKGGWVLNKLFGDNLRRTQDVDMSIKSAQVFNKAMTNLQKYCDTLVIQGEIVRYKIKVPLDDGTKSGGLKLFRVVDGKRRIVTGYDISIKNLEYGTVILNNGLVTFTFERMLADKISALLSERYLTRVRDLYDLYLICNYCKVDIPTLAEYCKLRNVDLFSKTGILLNADTKELYSKWQQFSEEENRTSQYVILRDCLNVLYTLISEVRRYDNHR